MKKAIISVLSAAAGAAVGAVVVDSQKEKDIQKMKDMSEKHLALFLMMNQWVAVKQKGKNLASYFEEKGYKKIAVYGMSYAGERLVDELKETGIEVVYGIDRNVAGIYADIDVISADDELEDVDAVVVTAITFFDEIEGKLSQKLDCPIISLEDILYEV